MNKLYALISVIVGAILIVGIVFASSYGMRWFNSQTVQTQIIQPTENIECVIVTTTDGAAVNCWEKL